MVKTRGRRSTKVTELTYCQGRVIKLGLIKAQAYYRHHSVELLYGATALIIVGDKGFEDDRWGA
jgi:hypothetical protein